MWWEPLRKKNVFQCTNCQRIGHSSANCHLQYRCVKCSKSHNPGECEIPKENTNKDILYCVNCKSNGLPASYKGCPFYKTTNTIKKARLNISRNNHRPRINDLSHNVNAINNKQNPPEGETSAYYNSNEMYPPLTHPNSQSAPAQNNQFNQWSNYPNNSHHLFPPQDNNVNFFLELLNETKNQIINSINGQLSELRKGFSQYMYKVDRLYTHLGLHNE